MSPRRAVIWPLLKGCFFTSLGLIILLFLFRRELARLVPPMFGVVSFVLIFTKEELMRLGLRSKFARSQMERRFILVGTRDETEGMRRQLRARGRRRGWWCWRNWI